MWVLFLFLSPLSLIELISLIRTLQNYILKMKLLFFQSLRILSINVGGLRSKVESPDFENFIITYDIVCIIETHFDIFDSISINGFKLLPTMVRRNAKSGSAGIAILVRESIYDSIKVVKNSGENFYWFSCSSCSDILFCVSYIPPEGSTYSDISIFDTLEADILELSDNSESKICLLGDFNARSGKQQDIILMTKLWSNSYIVTIQTMNLLKLTLAVWVFQLKDTIWTISRTIMESV